MEDDVTRERREKRRITDPRLVSRRKGKTTQMGTKMDDDNFTKFTPLK
jgi:hypothetical protein